MLVVGFLRVVGAVGGGGGGEEAATTTTTRAPTTTTTLPAPPACTVGEVTVRGNPAAEWMSVIIDTQRRLPADFTPPDLVDASEAGFPPGFKVRQLMVADLRAMREAAKSNGTPIGLIAAFRTAAQQADLYDRREQQLGAAAAVHRAARGGHSEHQLGTSIDVGNEGDLDVVQAWGNSATGKWVAANAPNYGFVISYPQGATASTCYDYEPWHLRYVGRERARAVTASGLTLREYLWALAKGATPPTSAG